MQWRHNQALIEQKDEARKLDYFLEKTKESLVLNAYFLPDFRWSRAPLSCCNSLAYTDICIRLESIHVLIQICTEKSIKILNIYNFCFALRMMPKTLLNFYLTCFSMTFVSLTEAGNLIMSCSWCSSNFFGCIFIALIDVKVGHIDIKW